MGFLTATRAVQSLQPESQIGCLLVVLALLCNEVISKSAEITMSNHSRAADMSNLGSWFESEGTRARMAVRFGVDELLTRISAVNTRLSNDIRACFQQFDTSVLMLWGKTARAKGRECPQFLPWLTSNYPSLSKQVEQVLNPPVASAATATAKMSKECKQAVGKIGLFVLDNPDVKDNAAIVKGAKLTATELGEIAGYIAESGLKLKDLLSAGI